MPRLPQPGGDAENWGEILNDFLSESHNPDGSLKDIAQGKVTGLSAALSAKADASAIPTTPAQVGAEPEGLSEETKAELNGTIATGAGSAINSQVTLDALAAGNRLKAILTGNESETARGVTVGTATAVVATSAVSIGTCTFTDATDLVTTSVPHGFTDGQTVVFGTVTSTTGVTAGEPYYVRDATTSTFKLTTTPGGSVRALTNDGSSVAVYCREWAFLPTPNTVNPAFRVTDTRAVQASPNYPRYVHIAPDPTIITYAPGTATKTGMRIEVEYEGTRLGILLRNTAGLRGQMFVDGLPVDTFSNAEMTTDGVASNSVGRITLSFTTARRRVVVLEFEGDSEFVGFDIQPAYPLIFPTANPKGARVLIAGDSFTEGTGAGTSRPYTRWLAHLLGWRDVWKCGSGSTGYVTDGSRLALIDRYANDIIAQQAQVVIIAMGLNDSAQPVVDVVAAAETIWDATLASSYTQELIIIGPWPNGGGNGTITQGIIDLDLALAALANAKGVRYISPVQEGWKYTVAGGGDPTHPSPAGHEYIATRIAGHLAIPYVAA